MNDPSFNQIPLSPESLTIYRATRWERVSCMGTAEIEWSLFQGEQLVAKQRTEPTATGAHRHDSEVQFSLWPGAMLQASADVLDTIGIVVLVVLDTQQEISHED